jgi:ribosomal protein S18 acetylase RimI-like enzyme
MELTPDQGGSRAGGHPDAVSVVLGTRADAAVAARLHCGQIAEGFLASLGQPFLRRLYGRIAESPGSFLLMADDAGTRVGFLAGTVDVGALYRRFLVRDGLLAGLRSAPRLLKAWPRAVETLRHGGGEAGGDADGSAELLAVAVDPGWRGRRIGAVLVSRFQEEVARAGAGSARVVVGRENKPAIGLYERAGFELVEDFELHPGVTSLLMRWQTTA